MSTNIIKYYGNEFCYSLWGFYFEYSRITGRMVFSTVYNSYDINKYKGNGVDDNNSEITFKLHIKIRRGKNSSRFIPLQDFDKFLGKLSRSSYFKYFGEFILDEIWGSFNYSPIRFEDV